MQLKMKMQPNMEEPTDERRIYTSGIELLRYK